MGLRARVVGRGVWVWAVVGDCSGEAGAGYVGGGEQRAFEAGYLDAAEVGVLYVDEDDALVQVPVMLVRVRPSRGLSGVMLRTSTSMGASVVGECNADVGEAEVAEERDACVAHYGVCAVRFAGGGVGDLKEALAHAGDVAVGGGDVFDEGSAADAALDEDGVGAGVGELALLDADVADCRRRFRCRCRCRRIRSRRGCSW